MKLFKYTGIACMIGLFLFHGNMTQAQTMSQPDIINMKPDLRQNAARACLFPIGGWTIVDCSAVAAAQSAQLAAWSRYVVMCRSDSYVAWGDEATDEADANDGYLPASAWLEFLTDGKVRYFSCLNVTTDTDCRFIKCL